MGRIVVIPWLIFNPIVGIDVKFVDLGTIEISIFQSELFARVELIANPGAQLPSKPTLLAFKGKRICIGTCVGRTTKGGLGAKKRSKQPKRSRCRRQ